MNKRILVIMVMMVVLTACRRGNMQEAGASGQVSMIMLRGPVSITEASLSSFLKETTSGKLAIREFAVKDGSYVFNIGDATIAVAEMPVPIPADELKFPIATAWMWNSARADIANHKRHLIVYCGAKKPKLEIARILSSVTSALLSSTDSIGVYWGSSSQVIRSDMFKEFAKLEGEDDLPVPILVSVTGFKNPDGSMYLYTIGLKEFGLREFEVEHYRGTQPEGFIYLLDMAKYVLRRGPIIHDGDSIGRSEEERIIAKHKKSTLHPEEDVISIPF